MDQKVKNLSAMRETWVGKISWRRERLPTPIFWPGEFHRLYSSWGHKESDMTDFQSINQSPALQTDSLPTELSGKWGKPHFLFMLYRSCRKDTVNWICQLRQIKSFYFQTAFLHQVLRGCYKHPLHGKTTHLYSVRK